MYVTPAASIIQIVAFLYICCLISVSKIGEHKRIIVPFLLFPITRLLEFRWTCKYYLVEKLWSQELRVALYFQLN